MEIFAFAYFVWRIFIIPQIRKCSCSFIILTIFQHGYSIVILYGRKDNGIDYYYDHYNNTKHNWADNNYFFVFFCSFLGNLDFFYFNLIFLFSFPASFNYWFWRLIITKWYKNFFCFIKFGYCLYNILFDESIVIWFGFRNQIISLFIFFWILQLFDFFITFAYHFIWILITWKTFKYLFCFFDLICVRRLIKTVCFLICPFKICKTVTLIDVMLMFSDFCIILFNKFFAVFVIGYVLKYFFCSGQFISVRKFVFVYSQCFLVILFAVFKIITLVYAVNIRLYFVFYLIISEFHYFLIITAVLEWLGQIF